MDTGIHLVAPLLAMLLLLRAIGAEDGQ